MESAVAAAVVVVDVDDGDVVEVVVEVVIDWMVSIDRNYLVHYLDCYSIHSIADYSMVVHGYPMNVYVMSRSFYFASHSDWNANVFHWDFHFLDLTNLRCIFIEQWTKTEADENDYLIHLYLLLL